MCKLKSAIILKGRIFVPDYDSHSKMLEELGIEDDYLGASKTFVRAELSPKDGDAFTPVDEWEFRVDQDIVPDWFSEEEYKPYMMDAVKKWAMNRIHVGKTGLEIYGGENHYIKDCEVIEIIGDTMVSEISGNATVSVISGNAKVISICGNAEVGEINGRTTVSAIYGDAKVSEIRGETTVSAIYGNAEVGEINGYAFVSTSGAVPWENIEKTAILGFSTLRDFYNKKIYQAGGFEFVPGRIRRDERDWRKSDE